MQAPTYTRYIPTIPTFNGLAIQSLIVENHQHFKFNETEN